MLLLAILILALIIAYKNDSDSIVYGDNGLWLYSYKNKCMCLNSVAQMITLKSGDVIKSYSYNKVKSWRCSYLEDYKLSGLATVTLLKNHSDLKINPSFYIEINDPDYPVWIINFKYKKYIKKDNTLKYIDFTLNRWMFIFQSQIGTIFREEFNCSSDSQGSANVITD